MESGFHGLPPLKRFSLMQRQQQQEASVSRVTPLCLPAKKRKECRDSPPNSINTASYCLPAKKRIWALQTLDLNLEYEPHLDSDEQDLSGRKDPEVHIREGKIEDGGGKTRAENASSQGNVVDGEEDGIVCAICGSTDGDPADPIVLCDGCDLMVHTTCYGHPLSQGIPEGDWFCTKCLASDPAKSPAPMKQISCCLCPVPGGALKPTTDGKWAHLVCAIYVPEVYFDKPEVREGIDCSKVLRRRWENKCYVCGSKKGCVIDCSEPKCPLVFHVTCGLREELCIEYRQGKKNGAVVAAFCKSHTNLWKKQEQTGKFKIVARHENEK